MVLFVSKLLHAERRWRHPQGTPVAGLLHPGGAHFRWFIDGTRIKQLAVDNAISVKTVYRYLHEGIDLLAAHALDLNQALTAAYKAQSDYRLT
jgi:hypothetical protein